MSGETHTPGPWRVEQDTTLIWGDCVPDDQSTYGMGIPIAEARQGLGGSMNWNRRSISWQESEANARLIAAAPELLEALEEARTSLLIVAEQVLGESKSAPQWDGVYEKLMPYVDKARAAIAKARGQAQ